MKSTKIYAALILMSFAAACVPRQRIEVDCIWAREISWTTQEGDAIVTHAEPVARQLLAHNEKYRKYCQ